MAMKIRGSLWISLVVAVALAACAVPPPPPAVQAPWTAESLVGVDWVATDIQGAVPVLSPQPRLRWTSAQQVVGSGGCNGFFGSAVVLGLGSVRIGPLKPTGKGCITAPSGQEDMFFKALEQTRGVRLEERHLVLLDESGKPLARLVQAD